uniref:Uracil phosphoribosyltransferase n=1 Tax=Kuetzingia canaliculata TaxID=228262 RepID=A0A1Z1MPG0_KUECA|nr:uracil phosphoribosyltransferase [Kuetzingia canaliculata]ARW67977.1 uracil phosphoribosyltransferase [Kuetzingia canaliculata]
MTLSIYTISHPIIKILSNYIIDEKENADIDIHYHKYLGFLLIYEILRQHIVIRKTYIKSLYCIKNFYLVDNNKKYIIFTNLSKNYKLISEVQILIPDIQVVHTDYKKYNDFEINSFLSQKNNLHIFVLEKIINKNNRLIINFIEYLNFHKKIKLKSINIACIASHQEALTKLSYKYPKLTIYTSEIIYSK